MLTNNQTDLLPIVIEGQIFKPNAEGLWSLNEIHKTLNLSEAKRPSEWSNAVSAELFASGNFRKVDKVGWDFEVSGIADVMAQAKVRIKLANPEDPTEKLQVEVVDFPLITRVVVKP